MYALVRTTLCGRHPDCATELSCGYSSSTARCHPMTMKRRRRITMIRRRRVCSRRDMP
jgi:hypothetical protein